MSNYNDCEECGEPDFFITDINDKTLCRDCYQLYIHGKLDDKDEE